MRKRVALTVGKPGYSGTQYADSAEHKGMSTRMKLGLGAATVLGCDYMGCFSESGSSSR